MFTNTVLVTISFFVVSVKAQTEMISSKRAIRTFDLVDDSMFYSDNDHLLIAKNGIVGKRIYPGGYLLDFELLGGNKIMTIANNYKLQKGSLRIFDLDKGQYFLVYKIEKHSPMLAYSLFPYERDTLAVMVSYNDGSLYWYESNGKPIKSWKGHNKIRRMEKVRNLLYYCTDNGKLLSTDGSKSRLVFDSGERINGFKVYKENIYAFDDKGRIIKFDISKNERKIYKICSESIMDLIVLNEKEVVIGDWDGNICTINILTGTISKTKGHSRMVLKLRRVDKHKFMSSGQDGTIKMWRADKI